MNDRGNSIEMRRVLSLVTAIGLGGIAQTAHAQNFPPPPAPSLPDPTEQTNTFRDTEIARNYFQSLGEGKIGMDRAPTRGVIMRFVGGSEVPTLESLREIFAGCKLVSTTIVHQVGPRGPISEGYVSEFECSDDSPDPLLTVAYRVVGNDVDDLRVAFSAARRSRSK